jgi:hypothetical protein
MAAAATLQDAAGESYVDLFQWFDANSLKAHMTTFINGILATGLTDTNLEHRPVRDWVVLLGAIRDRMADAPSRSPYLVYIDAADAVYRTCWAADVSRIGVALKAAVLAAFNAAF